VRLSLSSQAQRATLSLAIRDAWEAAWETNRQGANVLDSSVCDLLRCIFGTLFRPGAIEPAWLAWNDGNIPKLAQAIYDDRAFDRLPILADTLHEAGCTNGDMLGHCRGSGHHVSGCWVLDLLLGKE